MMTLTNGTRSLLLSGALLIAAFANAQQGQKAKERTPEQRAAQRTEWMTKELSLSPEQSKQIEGIQLQHMSKIMSIRSIEDPEQKKQAMREARHSQRDAMEKVLSKEQQERLVELKAERKKQHQERKAQGARKEGEVPRKEMQEKR